MRGISVLISVAASLAADVASAYRVGFSLPSANTRWQRAESIQADLTQRFTLIFHLTHGEEDAILDALLRVSTPGSSEYSKYLATEEIKKIAAAKPDAAEAVTGWLEAALGTDAYITKRAHDSLHVDLTVAEANELLKAEYKILEDLEGNKALVAPEYHLPDDLRFAIEDVQPTNILPGLWTGPRRDPWTKPAPATEETIYDLAGEEEEEKKKKRADWGPYSPWLPGACGANDNDTCTTPYYFAQLYNFTNYVGKNNTKLGIFAFPGMAARFADLEQFVDTYAPGKIGANLTVVLLNGGTNPQALQSQRELEGQLDAQVAVSLSSPVENFYYMTGDDAGPDYGFIEPVYDFFSYLLDVPEDQLPRVVTLSYGWSEPLMNEAYTRRLCNLMAQVGTRGVSIIFSSGDGGPGDTCLFEDYQLFDPGAGHLSGHFQELNNTARFQAQFPASCPWVTTVGSTQSVSRPEQAAYWSAGGFSDIFPRPAYQNCSVSNFLNGHPEAWKDWENDNLFNTSGRAFPDVAAAGNNWIVINNETAVFGVKGTSVSAPAFASIIALLNSERASNGQPPLGFLNPWLYSQKVQDSLALTDITQGKSLGCDGMSKGNLSALPSGTPYAIIPGAGWKAVEGWDPVTGLGTPWFPGLLAALPD